MTEILEIRDFSGGVTDYPLNSALNKAEYAENLLLERQGGTSRYVLRHGSDYFTTSPQIPPGEQRIGALYTLGDHLLVHTSNRLYSIKYTVANQPYVDTALFGGPFNGADASRTLTASKFCTDGYLIGGKTSWPVIAYLNASGIPKSHTAGLPKPTTPIISGSAAGTNNWLYKYVYRYDFNIGGVAYVILSEPSATLQQLSVASVTLGSVPTTYTNAVDTFFPTTPTVEVYRTINNGTVFYYEGSVNSPTTSFLSNMSDATLQTQKRLYTEGGVQPNTKPPFAEIVHVNADLGYYAGITADPGKLYQSIPGITWGVPTSFNATIDDTITGVSSVNGVTIVLCRNSVFRVDGRFDSTGRGGMSLQRISDTASCVSAQSVVQTEDGLYWAGENGVFFSDGYKVLRLNEDYDKTWQNFMHVTGGASFTSDVKKIQGKYDPREKRVYWSVQRDEFSYDCDVLYVLDIRSGISSTSSFSQISGGFPGKYPDGTNAHSYFTCGSIEFVPRYSLNSNTGAMFRGDSKGCLHYHPYGNEAAPMLTYDRSYKTGSPFTDHPKVGIPYTYRSPSFNMGSNTQRKWVPRMNLNLDYVRARTSPITADFDIRSINDAGDKYTYLDTVSRDPVTTTDNVNYSFASKWRHFPRTSLRCVYKQIEMTPSDVLLDESEVGNLASVSGVTVTLGIGLNADVTNFSYIYFADDGFTQGYFITAITNTRTVLTVWGPPFPPGGTGKSWKIRGISKDVIYPVLSYSIHYTPLRDSVQAFSTSEANT